ncbi:MAG: trypsin-like peptidase domain-containing protein [Oscillospiraceae bacterium]|nr:trypsin-like peptidase domain-containing protein [Oscillospiraceae bacterium]
MKYCPYCGAELSGNARFCPECGKRLTRKKIDNSAAEEWQREARNLSKRRKKSPVGWILLLIVVIAAAGYIVYFRSFASSPVPTAATHTPAATISAEPTPAASLSVAFSDDTTAIQAASNSIVMLSCYDQYGELCATGSAFAAYDDGMFVTNCHVIMGDTYFIKAQTEDGQEFNLSKVVAFDIDADIAILSVGTGVNVNLARLPVGDSSALEKGAKVVAIGSPLGLINSVSTGVYSGSVTEDGQTYLQFTASISHGSSGGALFNDHGEVVGITSASYVEGQNLNLAIPIEQATELWNRNSPARSMSISAFYGLWDHVNTYDVAYVLSHGAELIGQEVYIEGYISSIDYGSRNGNEVLNGNLYLVSSPYAVLGYVFQEGAEWDYSNGNRQAQDTMRTFSLECFPILNINRDEVRVFSPGSYVKVHCQITRFEEFQEGSYFTGSRYISIAAA